jgi:hypothetical protein
VLSLAGDAAPQKVAQAMDRPYRKSAFAPQLLPKIRRLQRNRTAPRESRSRAPSSSSWR